MAEATGEIVMKTDQSSRFWGYLGPVMHWFYFTPLRAGRAPLWNNLIVYGSVVGCVLCILGLVIGVYRFSLSRRFKRGTSMTPYVGWLQWHHYAGLLFGVFALTWTFSGLLTMTPWNVLDQGGPTLEQVSAIRGDGVAVERFTVAPTMALAEFQTQFQPKEVELLQFLGEPFYAAYQRADPSSASAPGHGPLCPGRCELSRVLVTADDGPRVKDGFTRDELLAAARAAMPGMEPVDVTWLTDVDAYYYQRTGGTRLPALRAKFNDPDETWLYLDSRDGSLVQTEVRESRIERWLYQGLHSLDFPWVYQTPWVWYPLIVGLSLGGLALSLTSAVRGVAIPAREGAPRRRGAGPAESIRVTIAFVKSKGASNGPQSRRRPPSAIAQEAVSPCAAVCSLTLVSLGSGAFRTGRFRGSGYRPREPRLRRDRDSLAGHAAMTGVRGLLAPVRRPSAADVRRRAAARRGKASDGIGDREGQGGARARRQSIFVILTGTPFRNSCVSP